MRVLVVRPGPNFSVSDVSRGWVKGLKQVGCTVVDMNYDERLDFYCAAALEKDGEFVKAFNQEQAAVLASKGILAVCYEYDPDVVIIVSGFFVPPMIYDVMRARGVKVVLLHTESPYEDDKQSVRAERADLNIINDPTNLSMFPDGSLYLPHCYDPDIHHPRPSQADAVSDFCFVGTGYESRIDFLEKVDWSGIDVAIGGNWTQLADDSPLLPFLAHKRNECCPNENAAILYASTKASANLYRGSAEATHNADGWAMGPREVELAAIGTFFLRDSRGESDEVLPMLPTFESPDDFGEQLRWWLAHDDARIEAARLARMAIADRTFDKNAARLLNALGV
jgi:spore maturation protein CgeB